METPKEPFEMEISEGKRLYDIVGFQDTSNFAISSRLYELLNESNISGWKGFEILISGSRLLYYGFQVLGYCSQLDRPKNPGFYTGYKFDIDSWDGSDFFSPKGTTLLFCTKRVKELFEMSKVTNSEFTDIQKVRAYSVGC